MPSTSFFGLHDLERDLDEVSGARIHRGYTQRPVAIHVGVRYGRYGQHTQDSKRRVIVTAARIHEVSGAQSRPTADGVGFPAIENRLNKLGLEP